MIIYLKKKHINYQHVTNKIDKKNLKKTKERQEKPHRSHNTRPRFLHVARVTCLTILTHLHADAAAGHSNQKNVTGEINRVDGDKKFTTSTQPLHTHHAR